MTMSLQANTSFSLRNTSNNSENIRNESSVLCSSPLEQDEGVKVLLLLFYIVVIVLAIFGNTLIIHIVYSNRSMRTSTNIFITNMAVCDLGIPFFLLPKRISELLSGPHYAWLIAGDAGLVLCKLVPFIHDISVDCSTFSLLLITFDRFCAVLLPHKRHLLSNKVVIILIVCAWLASISVDAVFLKIFTTVYRDDGKLYCLPEWHSKTAADTYIRTLICTNIIIPFILISFAYSAIFRKLKKQVQILGNSISDQLRRQESLRQKKIVKMTFVIICTFGVCWLPVIFTALLRPFYNLNAKAVQYPCWIYEFARVSGKIQILTSITNPVVCFTFSLKFREEFFRIFWGFFFCCCRANRRVGNSDQSTDENNAREG